MSIEILSKYLKSMQDKNYSTDTKMKILETTARCANPPKAAEEAIVIINSSKTEQEALERIRARFPNTETTPNITPEI